MRKIIKFGENVMVEDVYEVCPIYKKEYIALKQTTMEIVNENFYELFQVEAIITKAVQADTERINSLILNGYK